MKDTQFEYAASVGEVKLSARAHEDGSVHVDNGDGSVVIHVTGESLWSRNVTRDGESDPCYVVRGDSDEEYVVYCRGEVVRVSLESPRHQLVNRLSRQAEGNLPKRQVVRAPMPGLLKEHMVGEGDIVSKGDALSILEAMKMENEIRAAGEFTVRKIFVESGNAVEKGTPLIELGPVESNESE